MQNAFLIITYGSTYIQSCITSIRQFYPEILICIVDNNIQAPNLKFDDTLIRYSKNIGNFYELGSIWFATKTWKDVGKFIVFHNTFVLKKPLPIENRYTPLWVGSVANYSPVVPWVEKQLLQCNLMFEKNKVFSSICGCSCIIETSILSKLIENGFDKLYATSKLEAVGTEIIFGYLIHIYLGFTAVPLHEYPIHIYINGTKPWDWIEKIGSGQGGHINHGSYNLDLNLLPSGYKEYNNINNLLIYLLKYIDNRDDIAEILINSYPKTINVPGELHTVGTALGSIRHRMFTKRYFRDYYRQEFEDIISGEKILF